MKVTTLLVGLLVIFALSTLPFQSHIVANAVITPSVFNVSIYKGAGAGPQGAPGYSPDKITVIIGMNNTVVWKNNDVVAHTATGFGGSVNAPPPFDTGNIDPGQTTNPITLDKPGTYPYFCQYHPWMKATIDVLAAGSTKPPTTSTPTTPSPSQPTATNTSPPPPPTQTITTPTATTTPPPTSTPTSTTTQTPSEKITTTPTLTQNPTPPPQALPPATTTTPVTATTSPASTQATTNQVPVGTIVIIAIVIIVVAGIVIAVSRRKR